MQKNPSHHLVEVNIDKNDAGDILERAFFGEITNTSRTCWSQRNVNRHKNLNHGGKAHKKYLAAYDIIPKGVTKIPRGMIKRYDNLEDQHRQLKIPTPIFTVGLPVAKTDVIDSFIRCRGLRSAHKDCDASLLSYGEHPAPYATKMEQNLSLNMPMFYFTGDFLSYTMVEDTSKCFLPQVTHLEAIHEHYPNATLVLNKLGNPNEWFESNHEIEIVQQLDHCLEILKKTFPDFGRGIGDRVKYLYEYHLSAVRNFAKKIPSHELVEIKVDGNGKYSA